MKNLLLSLFVILAFNIVAANAQEIKIGIVDAEAVIQQSAKGKAFFSEVEKFQQTKKNEIDAMVNTYRAKERDVQARAASMSEDKRQEAAAELQDMQTKIKRAQEDAQRESQIKINIGLEGFQKELGPLIRQIALEKGLDLVLNLGGESNIVFISDRINITNDVIKRYDGMR